MYIIILYTYILYIIYVYRRTHNVFEALSPSSGLRFHEPLSYSPSSLLSVVFGTCWAGVEGGGKLKLLRRGRTLN